MQRSHTKKKQFIDKKNCVKFNLVHRDQKDPLIAKDESERVFVEVPTKYSAPNALKNENGLDIDPSELKSEQKKYGIDFEDDYNYLQHLRSADEVVSWEPVESRYRISKDGQVTDAGVDMLSDDGPKLKLPSSIFASQGDELKIGLLNQAAPISGPHPELDPDILAALDDDFDYENPDNLLDDDFIVKANEPSDETPSLSNQCIPEENEPHDSDREFNSDFDGSSDGENEDFDEFAMEETKSRFTNYSMTSSVMRRANGLKHIDNMFEQLYTTYDEEEMGAVENEDAENMGGFIEPDGERITQLIDEYHLKRNKDKTQFLEAIDEDDKMIPDSGSESEVEIEDVMENIPDKDKWDCETILTTYSTLYNHPTIIDDRAPRKDKIKLKKGIPEGILEKGLTTLNLKSLDEHNLRSGVGEYLTPGQGIHSVLSNASSIRPKGETPEQRRERKTIVKLERQERREEKKANKTAFKIEDKRLNSERINQAKTRALKLN